jgi:hypothetical protein
VRQFLTQNYSKKAENHTKQTYNADTDFGMKRKSEKMDHFQRQNSIIGIQRLKISFHLKMEKNETASRFTSIKDFSWTHSFDWNG